MSARTRYLVIAGILGAIALVLMFPAEAPQLTITVNGKPAAGQVLWFPAEDETVVLDGQGSGRPTTIREGNRHAFFRAGPDRYMALEFPLHGERTYRISAQGLQRETTVRWLGIFKRTEVVIQANGLLPPAEAAGPPSSPASGE